ncbi:hypothetical protein F4808DRAFT_129723 [Astrocystis sublimbata]|nr:hypothetical protein F4808DRAFT_129723 [Astrocystis sublimbata]
MRTRWLALWQTEADVTRNYARAISRYFWRSEPRVLWVAIIVIQVLQTIANSVIGGVPVTNTTFTSSRAQPYTLETLDTFVTVFLGSICGVSAMRMYIPPDGDRSTDGIQLSSRWRSYPRLNHP